MPHNFYQNQNLKVSQARQEQFAENFSRWELSGRGWQIFNHEIELEPAFSRFAPLQSITSPVDDGRVPSLFGRLLSTGQNPNRISDGGEVLANNSAEILAQPKPVVKTASFRIYLPNELKISSEQTQQLILNLASSASFVSFEIIGTNREITFQITCPELDKRVVLSQLKSHLPNVDFRETEDTLKQNLQPSRIAESVTVDFGLEKEWFIPLPFNKSFAADTLLPLIAAFEEIADGETVCLQILFSRARQHWQRAVQEAIFDRNGKLTFPYLQSYVPVIREKLSNPLLAAQIRFAAQSNSREKSLQIARNVSAFFRQFSYPGGNELIPLQNEDLEPHKHLQSILNRTSFRTGMLVSAQELSAFVHLPSDAVKSQKLCRDNNCTKLAPLFATQGNIILGENHHNGQKQTIKLSDDERIKHLWLTGSSGSGKTSLVNFLVAQDIEAGKGVTVIEPHGDSIENIISRIPERRLKDVILLDPGDEEFPVGFNILQANSELEKILLSSDLVAIFRRFSSSWGDVINSVLHNAILAFLSSTKGGSLLDLKHFLVDRQFREEFLKTVADAEIRFYWQKEFPQLVGKPHAPLLTRLDLFLRSKPIRNIIAQKDNKLDFRRIMDERKILLVKLTHGRIGETNAHMIGSLVMTKLYQAALSRQDMPETKRINHFIYLDEAHHFIVPSLALLLSGGRKFSCSLLFSHQETRQIASRDPELLGSLQTNCFTRICFRTDSDADTMAKGFSFFTAEHLKNLGVGEALVRLEQSRYDFNLKTFPLNKVSPENAAQRRTAAVEHTRKTYAKSKAEVESENQNYRQVSNTIVSLQSEQSIPVQNETVGFIKAEEANLESSKSVAFAQINQVNQGRGGRHHQELQAVINRMAESYSFQVEMEKSVSGGAGFVDVSLENENLKIACEVSVTSTADYETHNILKCLSAGYNYAVVVVSNQKKISALNAKLLTFVPFELQDKVKVLSLTGLLAFLRDLSSPKDSLQKKEKPTGQRLDLPQASEFLGISVSTLYRWVREGRIPFFRVGREYRFDRDELVLIGKHDLSGKRKATVKLESLKIEKTAPKGKKQQDERYRKLLKLE